MASPCMVFTPSGVHRKRHVVKVSCEMIYTVGHSTRELDDFLALLAAHGVRQVVDVRRYPASRRHPHFARDALEIGRASCRERGWVEEALVWLESYTWMSCG